MLEIQASLLAAVYLPQLGLEDGAVWLSEVGK